MIFVFNSMHAHRKFYLLLVISPCCFHLSLSSPYVLKPSDLLSVYLRLAPHSPTFSVSSSLCHVPLVCLVVPLHICPLCSPVSVFLCFASLWLDVCFLLFSQVAVSCPPHVSFCLPPVPVLTFCFRFPVMWYGSFLSIVRSVFLLLPRSCFRFAFLSVTCVYNLSPLSCRLRPFSSRLALVSLSFIPPCCLFPVNAESNSLSRSCSKNY